MTELALLRQKLERLRQAEGELAEAAASAKREGVPVAEIAEPLGYKTRRSVYLLLERHGLRADCARRARVR